MAGWPCIRMHWSHDPRRTKPWWMVTGRPPPLTCLQVAGWAISLAPRPRNDSVSTPKTEMPSYDPRQHRPTMASTGQGKTDSLGLWTAI